MHSNGHPSSLMAQSWAWRLAIGLIIVKVHSQGMDSDLQWI